MQEFDEFEVKMKVVKSETRMTPGQMEWSKWVETQTSFGTSSLAAALGNAVLSRNQGPSVPGDVDGRVAILNLIRVRDP